MAFVSPLLLLLGASVQGLVLPSSAASSMSSRVSTPAPRLHLWTAHRAEGVVMTAEDGAGKGKLPFFLDIGTKGGIVFYSIVGIALPFIAYSYMVDTLDLGVVLAGNVILVGYVGLGTVAWTGSYVFRVANKDMTYAQQLKDYENAVIQKRFEELSTDEVDALMGEIYPDKPAEK